MSKRLRLFLALAAWVWLFACNKSTEPKDGEPDPASEESPVGANGRITGNFRENETLKEGITYALDGFVFVDSGVTLTIEPGTKVASSGKSALIVRPGGKLMAQGTASKPIVFTSAEENPAQGDWAGVVLFGRAPVSSPDGILAFEADENETFGGDRADDNSGALEYVRIEYAGFTVATDKELNGLTLGGVGSGTSIHHVQSHLGSDDAFEWFGGTSHTEYLVATSQADDGFDIDEGYSGTSQYMLQVQGPNSDRGIEAGSKARDPNHITAPAWSNITIMANGSGPAVELKDNVSGGYSRMVVVGDSTVNVVAVKGAVTTAKVNDGTTNFTGSFYGGTFTKNFEGDGDATAEATLAAQFTASADPINGDYSAKDQAIIDAEAGAIPAGYLWYQGWTTGL